jgi:PAS domain S-box-containing protein
MVLLSPELDKIIRQNVKDESAYHAIYEMIARDQSSVDREAHYLKRLHQLATSQYDSLDAMFLAYLKVGCEVFGIEHGIIHHIENDRVYTQAIFPHAPFESIEIPLNQVMYQHVIEQHQTVAIHNISEIDPLPQSTKDTPVACYIGTPLVVDDTLWGTICFYEPQARDNSFTDTEIQFIELMAQGISHAISLYNNQQQTTENRYHFIFENIDTPIMMIDMDTYAIIEVNSAAAAFYGYSHEEFLTLSLVDLNMLPPSDIESKIMESREEGRLYVHFPHRLKAGEIREVEDYTNDLLIDNHHIRFSIIYDYSDRHEAQEALKHSEANLRAIFDNTSQLMFLVDDTANIVAMNRAASQLNESIHDGQPKTGETLYHYHIKSDHYLVSDYINRALQGQTISYESSITQRNNQPLYINYRYVPVKTPDDEIIGVCVTGQDITSLKLSQENLSRERNILRTLIDNLPDAIYIKDADARLLTANQSYVESAKTTSLEAIMGKNALDLYPDFGEQYYQDDMDVISHGTIINKDEPLIMSDNTEGIATVTKMPVYDDQSHIIGLVGIGRDITTQRGNESALRRRDEILSTINDAARQFLKDTNWRDSIEEILEQLGHSLNIERVYLKRNIEAETSLGAIYDYEWSAEGIPRHHTYPKSPVLPRWVEILQRGELLYGHIDDMRINEQQMMLTRDVRSIVMAPIMVGSHWWGIIGFDAIYSDRLWHPVELEALATAASTLGAAIQHEQIEKGLRDNEEKFNQLVTHIPEAFWIDDVASHQLIYANDNYETIFGVTIKDRQKDVNLFLEQVHPDDHHLIRESLHKQAQGEASQYDARFLEGEDNIRWISLRIYPIYNDEGNVHRVAGIASDITEQKQAETDRLEVLAQKERISILSSFFRDASHEFKTPLSIINTSVYILGKSDTLQTQQEHHQMIRDQVRNISELVDTLVLMSRLDTRTELTFAPINVNSIMRQVDYTIRSSYKERAEDIHVSVDETLPLILGHVNYITQALKNLVDNAVRYSNLGDSIYLRTYRDDTVVIIEVEDHGIGISDMELPEIYKRFYRGDEAHSTRGFGLGLPIARRITQRHGGDISVETELHRGSIFRMSFPIITVLNTQS